MFQMKQELHIELLSTAIIKVFLTLSLEPLPLPLNNNIFMMSLSNFTLAFYMLCPPIQWLAKHVKSNGEIGQRHHDDVVVKDKPLPIPSKLQYFKP
jgi:hypothetical protein